MVEYTLITGGNSGIGYEFSKIFAKEGHNLIIVGRNKESLLKVKNEIENEFKVKVYILQLDLTVDNSCGELFKFVEEKNLIVDNLINNAGVGSFGFFDEIDSCIDATLIEINIVALTTLLKYFLPKMKKRNSGGILNVASTAAFIGGPKMSTYYASKAYVLSLTEAIYEECRGFDIKVSCLCPGPVDTKFQSRATIRKSERAKKYLVSAKFVAQKGYKGFKNGKAIIIPGFKNKAMIFATKILPRRIIRKIIFLTNKGGEYGKV